MRTGACHWTDKQPREKKYVSSNKTCVCVLSSVRLRSRHSRQRYNLYNDLGGAATAAARPAASDGGGGGGGGNDEGWARRIGRAVWRGRCTGALRKAGPHLANEPRVAVVRAALARPDLIDAALLTALGGAETGCEARPRRA